MGCAASECEIVILVVEALPKWQFVDEVSMADEVVETWIEE